MAHGNANARRSENQLDKKYRQMAKEITKPDHTTKYLDFWRVKEYAKTSKWEIVSKTGHNLGYIKWFARWRQYCFFPYAGTVFNRQCMKDINEFVDVEMKARKK